ncbi:hypothetical protein LIA77_04348 [Sarocladium implicatum]|nr:hypothetical protein LIA77_04348 [Sarocladium implicatum]
MSVQSWTKLPQSSYLFSHDQQYAPMTALIDYYSEHQTERPVRHRYRPEISEVCCDDTMV